MHRWDVTPAEAIALQNQMRSQVNRQDCLDEVRRVAGVDVGFENNGEITRAVLAVLDFPSLKLLEVSVARQPTRFPYVPGLLSFREIPAILGTLASIKQRPDLILCDGQGIAHPRRFGIASHLGVLTDIPTIGVGKTRLVGEYDEPGNNKGDWSPLIHQGETIGAVLRTRAGVKPVYVSTGHCVSLETSIEFVLRCVTRYKLPETTRQAHHYASVEKSVGSFTVESK